MFSCNKVNSIVINTVKGKGYLATELSPKGRVLEKITGKHDDARVVTNFFKRMGYPKKNIHCISETATDTFQRITV